MLSYSRACDLLYAVAQSGDQTKKEDLAHTPLKHFYKTGPYDVDAEVLPRSAVTGLKVQELPHPVRNTQLNTPQLNTDTRCQATTHRT